MTWNEFVKHMEEELKRLGKDGNIEIGWMDFSYPTESTKPEVSLVEIGGEEELIVT